MNGLTKLRNVLRDGGNEIIVDRETARRAQLPITRLLEFAAARKQQILGNNDA